MRRNSQTDGVKKSFWKCVPVKCNEPKKGRLELRVSEKLVSNEMVQSEDFTAHCYFNYSCCRDNSQRWGIVKALEKGSVLWGKIKRWKLKYHKTSYITFYWVLWNKIRVAVQWLTVWPTFDKTISLSHTVWYSVAKEMSITSTLWSITVCLSVAIQQLRTLLWL